MYNYKVTIGGTRHVTITATTAADALLAAGWQGGKYTSRFGKSPNAADRDNAWVCGTQLPNGRNLGTTYHAARIGIDEKEAEHRNDVQVAREWVQCGHDLKELQAYGAYKSVSMADIA